jgi:hypothetical protein
MFLSISLTFRLSALLRFLSILGVSIFRELFAFHGVERFLGVTICNHFVKYIQDFDKYRDKINNLKTRNLSINQISGNFTFS